MIDIYEQNQQLYIVLDGKHREAFTAVAMKVSGSPSVYVGTPVFSLVQIDHHGTLSPTHSGLFRDIINTICYFKT